MKRLLFVLLSGMIGLHAQQIYRWSATTGDVSLSAATTTVTLQEPATNGSDTAVDQVVVYCSVACTVTQAANGSAATSTAGTINPLAPTPTNAPVPVNFFTSSNVGTGTTQGGTVHVPAGSTAVLCLSRACGTSADVVISRGGGTRANYSVSIGSMTGTANITVYFRSLL